MKITKLFLIILFLALTIIYYPQLNNTYGSSGTISLENDILTVDNTIDASDIFQAQLQNPSCSFTKYFIVSRILNGNSEVLNTWTPDSTYPLVKTHTIDKISSFSQQTHSAPLVDADRMQLYLQFMDDTDSCEALTPKAYTLTGDIILSLPTFLFAQLPSSYPSLLFAPTPTP